jgi:hypothetical protein
MRDVVLVEEFRVIGADRSLAKAVFVSVGRAPSCGTGALERRVLDCGVSSRMIGLRRVPARSWAAGEYWTRREGVSWRRVRGAMV